MKRIFDLLELYKKEYIHKETAFSIKRKNQWVRFSAQQYFEYSNLISQAFLNLRISKGTHVATILNNSPEWNFVDMGLLQIGAIQVPIYPTISKEHFRHIFIDAEINVAIISNKDIYNNIKEILEEFNIRTFSVEKINGLESFEDLLEEGKRHPTAERLSELSSAISEKDVATLIYTSGTTGLPKGVMLTHRNMVSQILAVAPISGMGVQHKSLSFLPLCHVYERMLNYMYQYLGLSIYYAESIEKVGENIRECNPHIFCAVPRVLEKTYDKIVAKGRDLKPIPKNIFFWALHLGKKYDPNLKGSLFYRIQLYVADKLIFSKWRKALGNQLDIIVSGSASLQEEIARVFWAARIKVMEGYGLTETSPVIAVSTLEPNGVKIGTVGPVLNGVEVKIADDGEILTRGPNVMKGYYKHPQWTKEIIDKEGWLKTGDIGEFEDSRFLRITDRKKEMIKTSGGKYIAPQVLENLLKSSPFIEQVIVIGDKKNYAAALIVPNFQHLKSWSAVKGLKYKGAEKAIKTHRIVRRIREEVVKTNYHLGQTEKIKKFILLSEPFSIEDQTLSPTLKLRRNEIIKNYTHLIEDLYDGKVGVDVIEKK
ncbi:MAG: AMP-dependent synthetase/ligase [Bacteroidales bacterium]|nr:AMP-dependent synthetase/ligase [Bacteroidales bacterium]